MTKETLSIIQIVLSVLVVIFILLQQKGEGLSGIFGGMGEFYATRRGLEKTIFIITIVLVFLLAASVVAGLFLV
ncbi:MAG: Preprotein translocase, SecG subunit [Parcubacteria group bacterium GW2011_GWC1_45_9]|nr:MAG: Preprotein translocase, SecG subunit [Parcubacteria group bacterium GW2011_GWB1_45_10]KKU17397.1 MAG: Preprotein translocase, SecG subunit [Parcubacteria group bacterium GW2011_GWC1_45_9]HCI05371.1 preprotein translocase subunit SecG [Patescibacteria group bacterium]